MDSRPIGVFDSGLGGLTVLKEVHETLPNENIVYLGDTARIPWGTRSKKTVEKFSLQCAYFLAGKGVKCVVVACNTASSNAIKKLRKEINIPIFDVVSASIDAVKLIEGKKTVGVIGTSATIKSHVHKNRLRKIKYRVKFEKACPLFVPLVENGETDGEIVTSISRKYLNENKNSVEILIMACTHYPIIRKSIQKAMGNGVTLVDPAVQLSQSLKRYLREQNMGNDDGKGDIEYYVTDFNASFESTASVFLNTKRLPKIKKAVLD